MRNDLVRALLLGLLFLSISASAEPVKGTECKTVACKAWESGVGAKPGAPTPCIIEIVAPTFGGKVGLDVRRNGKSLWGAPRIKHAQPGIVTYRVGCGWLKESTDEVYMCVKGLDGKIQYYSRRTRSAGELNDVLRTKRLEMCLKGDKCPKYEASAKPK